jgi:hypothetical protein
LKAGGLNLHHLHVWLLILAIGWDFYVTITQTLSYETVWLLHIMMAYFQERISRNKQVKGSHIAFYDVVTGVTKHCFHNRHKFKGTQTVPCNAGEHMRYDILV